MGKRCLSLFLSEVHCSNICVQSEILLETNDCCTDNALMILIIYSSELKLIQVPKIILKFPFVTGI